MRKYFLTIVMMIFMLAFFAPLQSNAAIADGTYSINYQVNKPGSSSASMANDYFLKPAKLIVKNGKMTMQLTIKNSAWVTQFSPPGGAKVISANEGADQRVVQFPAANADLITIAMKIDIDDIDYHHAYSVDFVFDSAGLPEAKVEEPKEEPKQETQQPVKPAAPVETPKTSSGSNTSSHTPATTEPKESTTESSKPVDNTEEAKGEEVEEDTTESQEAVVETEQDEQAEVVENPETSDELPLFAALLFIVAAIIFVRTKQTKTNG